MQKFDLPSTELCREFFLRIGKEIQVPRGATLPADDVFYILEGHVALTAVTADGECHSFMYFRPGQLFNFFPAVAGPAEYPLLSAVSVCLPSLCSCGQRRPAVLF